MVQSKGMADNRQRVLVLGASSVGGLGEAVARKFAADGCQVVVAGRKLAPLEALANDIGALAITCDITDDAQVRVMMEAAGPLDVAINASGTSTTFSIARSTCEQVEAQFAVHVTGNFSFLKHGLRAMPDGGSFVFFSSLTATIPGVGLAAYSGAKAALNHLVRVAALEYGPKKIRVNAVAPGFAKTPMTESFLEDQFFLDLYRGESPLGALVTPAQVAEAVAWLASPNCFMTGEIMQVSGGAQLGRLPRANDLARN
jgi:NAD(P)-dependent dehydrogenase (short-subunit alcohol dehydrogenase family)